MSKANNAARNDMGSWIQILPVRNIHRRSDLVEITHEYDGNNRKHHKCSALRCRF